MGSANISIVSEKAIQYVNKYIITIIKCLLKLNSVICIFDSYKILYHDKKYLIGLTHVSTLFLSTKGKQTSRDFKQ